MPKPRRPALNRSRERRIEQEIVVDAYTPDERAIGWHCYLDDKLRFSFKAKCIAMREISPLKKGEEVEVLGWRPRTIAWRRCVCARGAVCREGRSRSAETIKLL